MWFVLLGAGLALGALLTVQAGANAHLRSFVGAPISAAVVNFVVGLVALAGLAAATRVPIPSMASVERAPWWTWTGGLIGATYVAASVVLAPRLGVTLFFAVLIAGQLAAAVVVDHFGWLGFPEQRVNLGRLIGVGCLMAGVWLVRR